MNDWSLYKSRLQVKGDSNRERFVNATKDNIINQKKDLIACHQVLLNGVSIDIIINHGDSAGVKKFNVVDNVQIDYGDYIIWDDKYWLVTERDYDDDVHISGKITQCNYNLRWQNHAGDIVTRWCVINMVSKYNNGIFEGKIIDDLESTISVTLPYDTETVLIRRNKKFIMDLINTDPYVYVVSQRDVLSAHYGERGLVNLALSQTTSNSATDDTVEMIVGYDEDSEQECLITGSNIIRLGQVNTYETSRQTPAWSILSEDSQSNIIDIAEIVNTVDNRLIIRAFPTKTNINKRIIVSDGTDEFLVTIKALY